MVCWFICLFVSPHPRILFSLIFLEKVEGREVRERERNIDEKETPSIGCLLHACPGPRGEPLSRPEPRTLQFEGQPSNH